MFALQAGLAEVWKSVGVTPDMVIGHSFGEVTAAYLAGAIALEDVAHLVDERGLIRGHIDRIGGMAAIGMGAEDARALPADDGIDRDRRLQFADHGDGERRTARPSSG